MTVPLLADAAAGLAVSRVLIASWLILATAQWLVAAPLAVALVLAAGGSIAVLACCLVARSRATTRP